jgi:predicted nucleic acid-binding Zn ribbon protein
VRLDLPDTDSQNQISLQLFPLLGERIKGEGGRQKHTSNFHCVLYTQNMALIRCHECGGQVSDHARTCPKCGAPAIATIKRKRKATLIGLGIRLAFVSVVLIIVWIILRRLANQALAPLKAIEQKQQSH